MKTLSKKPRSAHMSMKKQRGLVLFISLVALVIMSLAAVALIRSVDTNSIIAGNLAFKHGATSSADAGIAAGSVWLLNTNNIYVNTPFVNDPALLHPFNVTNLANNPGYHSSANDDPTVAGYINLTDDATWNNKNNRMLAADASGNITKYIIQRMCRYANTQVSANDCLFGPPLPSGEPTSTPIMQKMCDPGIAGCNEPNLSPMLRITVRTEGPRNTVSYVQAFVY